jgi:hypothetical protein
MTRMLTGEDMAGDWVAVPEATYRYPFSRQAGFGFVPSGSPTSPRRSNGWISRLG